MVFNINNQNYIEFTEERYINFLQFNYLYVVQHELDFKHKNEPEITFFELTFYKNKEEASREYVKHFKSNSFIGHLVEDEIIEMIEVHDTVKFLTLLSPLS